jgi:hypothetical protein
MVSWETFFEIHSSFYTCVKEFRMGFVAGSDMLFEIFQLANVEIVCAVDYVSSYCC